MKLITYNSDLDPHNSPHGSEYLRVRALLGLVPTVVLRLSTLKLVNKQRSGGVGGVLILTSLCCKVIVENITSFKNAALSSSTLTIVVRTNSLTIVARFDKNSIPYCTNTHSSHVR